MPCPLCQFQDGFTVWPHPAVRDRDFRHCPGCDAVFVEFEQHPSLRTEKERYERHQNHAGDAGYLEFLHRTVREIQSRMPKSIRVLDFGSGPAPELSRLLRGAGYEVESYDPFFAPKFPQGTFDLIVAHEVFEHFRNPREELVRLDEFLKPGGTLLIRSEPRPDHTGFANWWYPRDPTHLFFASDRTLNWIAHWKNWRFEKWSPVLWAFRK